MTAFIIAIAVVALFLIIIYNGLVAKRAQVREAWSTINTMLKRRYDLIPNLVEVVKGAAKHEKGTLDSVVRARTAAMSAKDIDKKSKAETELSGALKSVFALSENYPTLRANENFLELQRELSDTETKIQAARQFYNTVVMGLNTKIEQFPSNIVASTFSFTKENFFELEESEKATVKKAPKVKF